MTTNTNPLTKPTDRDLTIIRYFSVPREIVFQAWAEPSRLAQWWGPEGFTNPVCEANVTPGGTLSIEMTDPDGIPYPIKGTFREVSPPERLVFVTMAFADESGKPHLEVLNTVTFEDDHGKTKLTIHATILTAQSDVSWALDSMNEGWHQSLTKLTNFLA